MWVHTRKAALSKNEDRIYILMSLNISTSIGTLLCYNLGSRDDLQEMVAEDLGH